MLKVGLVPVCLVAFALSVQGQVEQIQAVIDGIVSPQHAAEINAVLSVQPNVLMSRTDAHTKNVFMQVAPDCDLDLAAINHFIQPLGASARCFQRERSVPGRFKHLDPENCDARPTPHR